ncbi:efflux RND transporter periplasmic adaptor subunit [Roseivivax jejudonensis]|uniref:efflux RND transporter periplasmic adaptor subunit n=1 Tax=Roseivivax jejudonensis TaxID=1529041 RepID=UPI00135647A6|nr:efflux RND transporter periplasmic adaptor subunit [Roseivivax jejudonensis]
MTLVVVLGAGAVATGLSSAIAARTQATDGPDPVPAALVATAFAEEQRGFTVSRRFAGQIEPMRTAALAFEAGGTLSRVLVDEGDVVSEGELVARLDTRRLEAERARLRALRKADVARAELARRTSARQEDLAQSGFASDQRLDEVRLTLAELEAAIAQTDAALADITLRIEKAELRAPFAARVGTRAVDDGMAVGAGVPVLTLLEDSRPTFRVGLAPRLAHTLSPGDAHDVIVDGQAYPATVTAVRPDLDPATGTRTVILRLMDGAPPFRQSGTLRLDERIETPGFAVPLTALREGVRGAWTVTVAQPDGSGGHVAAMAAVEMIHADDRIAYVRGTIRTGARVVVDGTHRLVPRQRIRLAADEPGLASADIGRE